MLYIGEKVGSAQGNGPEDRHRARPARGHHDHRQRRPQRARGARHRRAGLPAQRARRLHGKARDRPAAIPRAPSTSQRSPTDNSARSPRPRASSPPRSSPACSTAPRHEAHHRRAARARLRDPADPRRRRRRRHRGRRSRHRHRRLYGHRRRARGRARGGRAALRRRADAGPAVFRNDDEVARARAGGSRIWSASTGSRTWPRATASSPRPASPTARCSRASTARKDCVTTESVVMRASTGTVRRVSTEYHDLEHRGL